MKKLTCDACGAVGVKHEVMGKNQEDVMKKMEQHMRKTHPEEWQKMMSMPKMEQDKMKEDSRKKITDVQEAM